MGYPMNFDYTSVGDGAHFGPGDKLPPKVAATALEDVADAINTVGKFQGKEVYNTSDDLMYFAQGSAAADPWHAFDGSNDITPA